MATETLQRRMKSTTGREMLIVALDCATQAMALNLVDTLGDEVLFYKVGWRLFLQGGLGLVVEIRNLGKDVFLDLKMDDIQETIETAVRAIGDEAMFLTVQGTPATVEAAVRGRQGRTHPKLLYVPLLSSLGEQDVRDMLPADLAASAGPDLLERYILQRAERGLQAGCDGFIASGQAIKHIRERFGPGPVIVSPGIRSSGSSINDHKRSATPREAIASGADYLVVGRPIHAAADPLGAARAILDEMNDALTSA